MRSLESIRPVNGGEHAQRNLGVLAHDEEPIAGLCAGTCLKRGMTARVRSRFGAGIAASLTAEAVFIAMVMMVSWLRGRDPWMVIRMPGSFVLGPAAVRPPGFEPPDVLIGMLVHLWLGVLVGLIYAALQPRLGVSPVVGGLITGVILYAIGF